MLIFLVFVGWLVWGFLLVFLVVVLIYLLISQLETGDFYNDFARFKIALLTERYSAQHLVTKEAFLTWMYSDLMIKPE